MHVQLFIRHASQIVQVVKDATECLTGAGMSRLAVLEGSDLSVAVGDCATIVALGEDAHVSEVVTSADREIDATGCSILPGLIDAHTHPVWAGDRVHEFAMKLAGASYMDIHAAGGGIHYTVEHTRNASEQELTDLLLQRSKQMLRSGTTTIEAKSGYGLDVETELKMLRAIHSAAKCTALEFSPTYCGGHAVPKDMTSERAAEEIVSNHIPALKQAMRDGDLYVENIDVFCEKGVFDVEQSRYILDAGKSNMCLAINFHGDELNPTQSAEMGASLGARAISHLEHVSPAGISAMAAAGSVAVLLPTTAFLLRLTPPPARALIDAGVPVALGTDFNPNGYCTSMPIALHLACVLFHMSMPEALVAATLNAAHSIGRGDTHGALTVGRRGDLVVLNATKWEHLIYQFGCTDSLIRFVVKDGHVVVDNSAAHASS